MGSSRGLLDPGNTQVRRPTIMNDETPLPSLTLTSHEQQALTSSKWVTKPNPAMLSCCSTVLPASDYPLSRLPWGGTWSGYLLVLVDGNGNVIDR